METHRLFARELTPVHDPASAMLFGKAPGPALTAVVLASLLVRKAACINACAEAGAGAGAA